MRGWQPEVWGVSLVLGTNISVDFKENGNSPSPPTPAWFQGRYQESDSKWKIFVEAGVGQEEEAHKEGKEKGEREQRAQTS